MSRFSGLGGFHTLTLVVIVAAMPTRSQRPLVAKLMALEPVKVAGLVYSDIDRALAGIGSTHTPEELADALRDHGVVVSTETLYRWRRDDLEG